MKGIIVETPIKISIINVAVGGYLALVDGDLEHSQTDYTKEKAVVAALIASGRIEVSDLDDIRRANAKKADSAPSVKSPEPMAVAYNSEPI
jgi:hypothetical protein